MHGSMITATASGIVAGSVDLAAAQPQLAQAAPGGQRAVDSAACIAAAAPLAICRALVAACALTAGRAARAAATAAGVAGRPVLQRSMLPLQLMEPLLRLLELQQQPLHLADRDHRAGNQPLLRMTQLRMDCCQRSLRLLRSRLCLRHLLLCSSPVCLR